MTNTIASITSNRQNALQATSSTPTDDQLITMTIAVVDDQSHVPQQNVPVYWGTAGVNTNVVKFYNMDKTTFDPATQFTMTNANGMASLYVASSQRCIAQILAALSKSVLANPRIERKDEGDWVGTTIAIWTVDTSGTLPQPVITENGRVTIPSATTGMLPAPSTNANAYIGTSHTFASDAQYVAWMCAGDNLAQLGTVLTIADYSPYSITIPVPYGYMQSGPNSKNQVAYMIYSGRQSRPSEVYEFSATGHALLRPDDQNNPPDDNLMPAQFVEPDSDPAVIDDTPPDLLSLDQSFDSKGNMNFVIPDYANEKLGVVRNDTDVINVTIYMNAWHHGVTTPNNVALTVDPPLTGAKFNYQVDGKTYARFLVKQSDCQDFCPYVDNPNLYGWIWIQYVINKQHYSQSFFTSINFCND